MLNNIKTYLKKIKLLTPPTKKKNMISSASFLNRGTIAFAHDVFMACLSLSLALWLRVGEDIVSYPFGFFLKHTIVISLISIAVFLWMQLYKGVWRYASINELIAITLAVTYISILYLPLMWLMSSSHAMPRSVIIINWFLLIGLLGGSRISYRIFRNHWDANKRERLSPIPQSRVLLIGVNHHTEMFIREVERNARALYEIVGIVDEKKSDIGRYVHGIEVMGALEDIPEIIDHLNARGHHPHHLIITDPLFKGKRLQKLLGLCNNLKVDIARLPSLTNLNKTSPHGIDIQPISIEDLLGRPEVALDRKAMQTFIKNRRVMITGAGGTIGGELVRQIAAFNPSHLTLIDHSEFLLYSINLEAAETFSSLSIKSILADVSDPIRITQIIEQEKPEIVFHAAALKHVPIAEDNPDEAILTNVVGTRNVAEACRKHKVKAMVFISTDKAVNPTSIMGATKRLSENFCQSLDALNKQKKETRFIVTRFGNVLGSTGSVVPLFKRQLSRGGPITVTDPRVTRYFMTVHEAIELVLQAAVMGYKSSTTAGQVFVLDMGESINISDLARQMIQLVGLKPNEDIRIEYTGLRTGEKLHEELFFKSEKLISTSCKGLMLATPKISSYKELSEEIEKLEKFARQHLTAKTLAHLKTLVPEYKNKMQTKKAV